MLRLLRKLQVDVFYIVLELNDFYTFHLNNHTNIGLEYLATGDCRFGSKLTAPAPVFFCTNAESLVPYSELFVFFSLQFCNARCYFFPPTISPQAHMYVDCSTAGAAETLEDHFEPLQIKMTIRTKHTKGMEGLWTKEWRQFQEESTKGKGHAGKCPEKEDEGSFGTQERGRDTARTKRIHQKREHEYSSWKNRLRHELFHQTEKASWRDWLEEYDIKRTWSLEKELAGGLKMVKGYRKAGPCFKLKDIVKIVTPPPIQSNAIIFIRYLGLRSACSPCFAWMWCQTARAATHPVQLEESHRNPPRVSWAWPEHKTWFRHTRLCQFSHIHSLLPNSHATGLEVFKIRFDLFQNQH